MNLVEQQKEEVEVMEVAQQLGAIADKLAQIQQFHNLPDTEPVQFVITAIDNHGHRLDFSVANISLSFPQALWQAFSPICMELFSEYEHALDVQFDALIDAIKQA